MDPEYARRYRALYEHHWWWRSREAFVLAALEPLRRPGEEMRVLDVGCGDGLFLDRLERFGEVEGVESDASVVDPAGKWASRIHVQSFETFEPDRRYSLVTLLDVLEHARDPTSFLRHAIDLLESGGSALVTVPAFRALWTSHDDLNEHVDRFSRARLDELAARAGARVTSSTYFFHWVVPLKLAQRAAEAALGARPRSPKVPPPWLNATLRAVSRVEQRTVSRLPIPFGSSLLAVLERAASSMA